MFLISRKDSSGYSTETHLNEVKWLASALSKDDGRFHVTHIMVNADQTAVATDGSRMHVVKQIALAPGFYRVMKQAAYAIALQRVNDEDTFDFPSIESLLEDADEAIKGKKHDYVEHDADKDARTEYIGLIRRMTDNGVTYSFFKRAVKGMNAGYVIANDRAGKKPIFIDDVGNRLAIVMPFQI